MTGTRTLEMRGMLRAPPGRLLGVVPCEPVTDRSRRGERWLLFELSDLSLRARCEETDEGERVASWTATFREPPATLRRAAERVGLWPELAPDAAARGSGPMLRRPLPSVDDDVVHSATAAVREGGIAQLTVFDEPPDWTAG